MSVAGTVSLRPGVPADAGQLALLGARTFRDAFAADNRPEDLAAYLARTYGLAQQSAELAGPDIATLLAEVDGRLAGFAQIRAGSAPACVTGSAPFELWRFYVDRPWQGQGVAQALMAGIADEAVHRGARTLWLGVWERNPRAIAFYRKCGFLDVGSQPFILGSDRQTDRILMRPLDSRTVPPRS